MSTTRFLVIGEDVRLQELLFDALTTAGHLPILCEGVEVLGWLEKALRRNDPPSAIVLDEQTLRGRDAADCPFHVRLLRLYSRWEALPPPLFLVTEESQLDLEYLGVRLLLHKPNGIIPKLLLTAA